MNLTKEQKELFDALHKARVTANEVFNQRAFRGVKPNVVDKYAETAHFVYELLQNADDAQATEASILLCRDKLIFKHNGHRQFTLTDANDNELMGTILLCKYRCYYSYHVREEIHQFLRQSLFCNCS